MINKQGKNKKRRVRHLRVRKKVSGTSARPRLNVYKSLNNVYAQIIDDTKGITLVSASTLDAEIKGKFKHCGNKAAAREVGTLVAKKAIEKGIDKVVFDRAGYIYHGVIKELGEAAREGGLQF
jgi:large subunit ribosomal protein L18